MQVVIVGASLGGLRTAQALRQHGFDGSIVLIGAEDHPPYDRPPLSKELLLGTKTAADATLASPADIEDLGVELRRPATATSLDVEGREVEVDGRALGFDHLVIATGANPRRLPFGRDLAGVQTLRRLEDAAVIRRAMEAGGRLAVIGAGFIGCEIASACVARGVPVTVLELLATPLFQSMGPDVGALVAELHREQGVDLRCGVGARELVPDGSGAVGALRLTDGSTLEAGTVVVGVGVAPETGWLDGSGLELADGVVCDSRLRAGGRAHIHAVGDVARWHHPVLDRLVRVEHWTHATESASFVARDILGADDSYGPVTYVWSDQLGHRLQVLGLPGPDDHFHIVHRRPDGRWVGLYESDGRLSAAAGLDLPGRLMRYRSLLARRTPWSEAMDLAAELGE